MENNNPPDQNDWNKKNEGPFQQPNFNPQNPNPYYQGNFQQQNFPGGILPPLPGATGALVLGIIGLFFSIICIYWVGAFVGLVCSIIALIMSNRAIKMYEQSPGMFSESSYGNVKAGRILSIIGLVISILWFLVLFIILFTAASFANSFRL